MTKQRFLTVRWNNILSVGLGTPTLIYVILAFSTSFWLEREGLIGLAIFGALFWIVIELHTATRFAWLQKNSANYVSVKQGYGHPLALIRLAYNAVFWVFLLPFLTTIDYGIGFVAFTIVIVVRFALSFYTNNVANLTLEQFDRYPFRIWLRSLYGKPNAVPLLSGKIWRHTAANSMNKVQTNTRKQLSMTDYVQYRNGVPLGASGSLQNMLVRSLGAGTFARFWQYWNPIWGYALGRYVYEPLSEFLPLSVSLILTFIISGGIHDLATMLVRGAPAFLFTPWFFLMGIVVVFGRLLKLDYSNQAFRVRVAINVTFILVCLMIAIGVKQLL